jgi:hypothetical protein
MKQLEIEAPRHIPDIKETALNSLLKKGAEYLQGDNIEETEPAGIEDIIINFAQKNPEIVQRFLGGGEKTEDLNTTTR